MSDAGAPKLARSLGPRRPAEKLDHLLAVLRAGKTITEAAATAGMSRDTARVLLRERGLSLAVLRNLHCAICGVLLQHPKGRAPEWVRVCPAVPCHTKAQQLRRRLQREAQERSRTAQSDQTK